MDRNPQANADGLQEGPDGGTDGADVDLRVGEDVFPYKWICAQWPEGLPDDFDHQLLRRLGLSTKVYMLMQESNRQVWRVRKIDDVVNELMDALGWRV